MPKASDEIVLEAIWTQASNVDPDETHNVISKKPDGKVDSVAAVIDGEKLTNGDIDKLIDPDGNGKTPGSWTITYTDPTTKQETTGTYAPGDLAKMLQDLPVYGPVELKGSGTEVDYDPLVKNEGPSGPVTPAGAYKVESQDKAGKTLTELGVLDGNKLAPSDVDKLIDPDGDGKTYSAFEITYTDPTDGSVKTDVKTATQLQNLLKDFVVKGPVLIKPTDTATDGATYNPLDTGTKPTTPSGDNTTTNPTVVNGKDGADGKNGADGKDGVNGKDGKNGKNGTNGTNGRNGTNGTTTTRTVSSGTSVSSGGKASALTGDDVMRLVIYLSLITVLAAGLGYAAWRRYRIEKLYADIESKPTVDTEWIERHLK